MTVKEHCGRCDHFNFKTNLCDRVLKAKLFLGIEDGRLSGDMNLETAPGLLTKALEADLAEYLSHWIPTVVEKWQGWPEVLRLKEQRECPALKENACIKEFGVRTLTVVKTGKEEPEVPGYLKIESQSGF